jgi:hypothetical protein
MLNFPKTGSSFARKAIKEVYRQRISMVSKVFERIGWRRSDVTELMLPKQIGPNNDVIRDQHGTVRQIPSMHRGKPIVTITRNPFARYVSSYLYGWWKKYPPAEPRRLAEEFSSFPDLSFSEYYQMLHVFAVPAKLGQLELEEDVGYATVQFVQFYFRRPEEILRAINAQYLKTGDFLRDLDEITFLHQEDLRSELKKFLLRVGRTESEVALLDSMENVNVTEKLGGQGSTSSFYEDTSLMEDIIRRDAMLFRIFPEYSLFLSDSETTS